MEIDAGICDNPDTIGGGYGACLRGWGMAQLSDNDRVRRVQIGNLDFLAERLINYTQQLHTFMFDVLGDDLEADIKGAKDSGIASVLIKRPSNKRIKANQDILPDYVVNSLLELEKLLHTELA